MWLLKWAHPYNFFISTKSKRSLPSKTYILRRMSRLNPHLKVDIHNVAVSNEFKTVQYQSGCQGCNGGIPSEDDHNNDKVISGFSVPAVRLLPYLEEHYTKLFIDNICFVKIDTEV